MVRSFWKRGLIGCRAILSFFPPCQTAARQTNDPAAGNAGRPHGANGVHAGRHRCGGPCCCRFEKHYCLDPGTQSDHCQPDESPVQIIDIASTGTDAMRFSDSGTRPVFFLSPTTERF